MKLDVQNLKFGYLTNNPVLDDISFNINFSSSVSIVGSSGCGKSSLLRLLSGILPDSKTQNFSGNILINDIDINLNLNHWQLVREKGEMGFMFQEPNLLPHLTVEENIMLPLEIIGENVNGEKIVGNYLKLTGLDQHKLKYPRHLSGGMKTRVALARTFISNPKLLLLDEPFSSLDVVWKSRLYEEVKRLKSQTQTTIVLVTHDIFEAIFFSKQIIILGTKGKILKIKNLQDWNDPKTYNEVIERHHTDFIDIKEIIEKDNL